MLSNNGGVTRLPSGLSTAVYSIDTTAQTAVIRAVCAGIGVADYQDAAVGDTLEFAGVEFKVSQLSKSAVRLTRTSG